MAEIDKKLSRLSISGIFFLHGMIFSSWAVRIPAIQEMHSLSEATLGSILLAKPIGSLLSMPVAAALVPRFGSKNVLMTAIFAYAATLVGLGLAPTVEVLIVCMTLFGMFSNIVNVSLNTQAVALETVYQRSIMASLRGLWSVAGLAGGAIGTTMISFQIVPYQHFLLTMSLAFIGVCFCSRYLLLDKSASPGKKAKAFQLPDRSLLLLGAIAFFSLICEGTMFDWSGIYFKKVLEAEGGWIGAGYVAFFTTMAGTRFFADRVRERLGFTRVLVVSGALIFCGLILSVSFPLVPVSMVGFMLVGCGVSSIIPMVYSQAGKSTSMSPSAAIAAVATTGYFGFLLGPPMIGWVAEISSLRISFLLIGFIGLMIAILAIRQKQH